MTFKNYTILAELGRGGMGIVYKAKDKRTDEIVAIKQLILENIDPNKHQEFRQRFNREANTALTLKHENIVKVFEISSEESSQYYVMEYLEGHSLRTEISRLGGMMQPKRFFSILEQVARGLAYAHNMNVVHRDVKPDNIFILKDGAVKLTDFGIARVADLEATTLTKTGVMLGTLAYVSPEQLQNAKTVDHRADIFSLGVVSYEALSGSLPFTGDGIAATIVKIMSQEEVPLNMVNSAIGAELSSSISRALRKRPRDRYRSVYDFVRDFGKSISSGSDKELELIDPVSTNVDVQISPELIDTANDVKEKAVVAEITPAESPSMSTEVTDFQALSLDREGVLKNKKKGAHDSVGGLNTNSFPGSDSSASIASGNTGDQHEAGAPPGKPGGMAQRLAQAGAPIQVDYQPVKLAFSIERFAENEKTFAEPTVVAYRSGRLVVSDSAKRAAYIFSRDGRFIANLTQRPDADSRTGGGRFTKPSGLAIDERGKIYVCDSSDHYIRIFDNQGVFLKEFKNIQGEEGGLQGIAVDTTGLLYVSDASTGTIQVFQSDVGVWIRGIGKKGVDDGEFQLPSGITTDRINRVYVVDYGTCRVSVFNKAGALIRCFGRKGKENGMFNIPRAVAVDRHDRIYVLDSLNHRIQVFSSAGDWMHSFGSLGKGPDQFVGPSDLCLDHENNLLYVADKGNQRIQVLELAFK